MALYTTVPLIYPEINGSQNQYTNILLIDSGVPNYQTFVDSVNSTTFPIVYSTMSSKTELLSLLQNNFTTISRIGIVFTSNGGNIKTFLDCKPFFEKNETVPYSDNLQFLIDIINEFQVKNIDYLACNTLNYSNWNNYYQKLSVNSGVVVGASDDLTGNIKYGGDWVMESTSQDIEFIYFTSSIEYYSFLLDNVTPWLTGLNMWPWYLYVYGNYMYVSDLNANLIKRIDMTAQTPTASSFVSSISSPGGMVIYGNYMYVTNYSGNTIRKVNLTDSTYTDYITSGLNRPFGLVLNGNYLYVSNSNANNIMQIDLTNNAVTTFVSSTQGLSTPYGLAISGNYMYSATFDGQSIQRIDMTTQTVTTFVNSGLNRPVGLVIYGNNLYVANPGTGTANYISQINLSTGTNVQYSIFANGVNVEGIAVYNNKLYTSTVGTKEIYQLDLPIVACFNEGSLILTHKGYVPVQKLRPGDLVKTLLHGFLPIVMIGKRTIVHEATNQRIKDQLYKCSQSEYPEIFEPLIITGCHSILVDEYANDEEKERTIQVNGNTYVTDDKYRLPVCADIRASVYEIPGTYTVYHFALENNDYYMNYGVYANGLLVETSSKRYIKELAGMKLID